MDVDQAFVALRTLARSMDLRLGDAAQAVLADPSRIRATGPTALPEVPNASIPADPSAATVDGWRRSL